MTPLIIGLLVFFGAHLLPTQPDLRAGLIERFGAGAYKGVFSILSLIGLVLIVIGYGKLQVLAGKNPQIWVPPTWTTPITLLLMLFSMILLVAAYVPSNIKRIVGHPMLAAVKIWAFAHLLANGDLASMVLFGAFLAYAVFDRISLKRRVAAANTEPSSAPSATAGSVTGDAIAVVGGIVIYAALLYGLHERLIGLPPVAGLGI